MMKKTEGFSLIELLVVVAIIGVLAAVGIVGYQQYIDNTKGDVAKTNAQSLERWVSSTQLARSGGLTVKPDDCSTDDATETLKACFDLTMTAAGGPLEKFKNPYTNSETANILAFFDNASTEFVKGASCVTSGAANLPNIVSRNGAEDNDTALTATSAQGVLVIQVTTADNITSTSNKVHVGYCDKEATYRPVADNITF